MLLIWLTSFLLTNALELPVLLLVFRDVSRKRVLLVGMLATSLTHPVLWWVWPHVVSDYTTAVLTGEILIVCVEAIVLGLGLQVGWRKALAGSALANGTSMVLGGLF